MTKLLLIGLLTLSSHVIAQDCFELAGRDYKIDPDLLRAISWHES
ncbi:lytic transglycosylase, partial [Shigella flexneri]